jgi:hypothetical protein
MKNFTKGQVLVKFDLVDQFNHILDIPKPGFDPRCHGGGHAKRRMHPRKIVKDEIDCEVVNVVFDFLAMAVRHSRKAAVLHSY